MLKTVGVVATGTGIVALCLGYLGISAGFVKSNLNYSEVCGIVVAG